MNDPRFEPQAPRLGQQVPEGTVRNELGKPIHLRDLVHGGPLILLFFGGSNDLPAVRRLLEFRDITLSFKRAGASLAAISTDEPSLSAFLRTERGLAFPLLSDEGGRVSAAFGMLDGDRARTAGFLLDAHLVVRQRWLGSQISAGALLTAVRRGAGKTQGRPKQPGKPSRLRQILSALQHAVRPARLVR